MRGMRGAHRPTRQVHRRCPGRTYYPDLDTARDAAKALGSIPAACATCRGFHMTLPKEARR